MKIGKVYIGVGVGAFILNENNEKMDSMAYGMLYDHWIRLYRYQGTSSS